MNGAREAKKRSNPSGRREKRETVTGRKRDGGRRSGDRLPHRRRMEPATPEGQ